MFYSQTINQLQQPKVKHDELMILNKTNRNKNVCQNTDLIKLKMYSQYINMNIHILSRKLKAVKTKLDIRTIKHKCISHKA